MKMKILTETKISRVWQFVEEPKHSFGIISANRSDNSKDENAEQRGKLLKDILENGYGFIRLIGGSTETLDNGEMVEITEPSFLISGIDKDKLIEWGEIYDQDSVLYKNKNGFQLISTSLRTGKEIGQSLGEFKFESGRENIDLGIEAVKKYYSRLEKGHHRDKKFAFSFKERVEINWMGGMAKFKPYWITIYEQK